MTDLGSQRRIGKYYILREAGSGGFGKVYEGYDLDLQRNVAIKVWSGDESELRRFQREARIWSTLDHPRITRILDYDRDVATGTHYLVQEFLSGVDLETKIRDRDQLPSALRLRYLIDIAEGLQFAHSRKVVHRDLSPRNIRVLHDHSIKIMDFGWATHVSDPTITVSEAGFGTRGYAAPEQLDDGRLADCRIDIFSFGVIAYELLTWRNPFQADTLEQYVTRLIESEPTSVVRLWSECPPGLAEMIHRCLKRSPEDRYDSCLDLLPTLQDSFKRLRAREIPVQRSDNEPEPTEVLSLQEIVASLESGRSLRRQAASHSVPPPREAESKSENDRQTSDELPVSESREPARRRLTYHSYGWLLGASVLAALFIFLVKDKTGDYPPTIDVTPQGPPVDAFLVSPATNVTAWFPLTSKNSGTIKKPQVELSATLPKGLDGPGLCYVYRAPAWPSGRKPYGDCTGGLLSYSDSEVVSGQEYIYRIKVLDGEKNLIATSSHVSIVAGR